MLNGNTAYSRGGAVAVDGITKDAALRASAKLRFCTLNSNRVVAQEVCKKKRHLPND